MLLSSTGFSLDVHYCQGHLKSISLFGKAKSCHEKQVTPQCYDTKNSCHPEDNGANNVDKEKCCNNETLVIEKSELVTTLAQLDTVQEIQKDFDVAFKVVYVFNYSAQTNFQASQPYKPPFPDRDRQKLYQTFLI